MSRMLSEVHENARGLHRIGLVSDDEMRKFDALCIPEIPTDSAEMIRDIRAKTKLTQSVFASLMNISISTLQKWEIGAKKPVGAARKLLHIVDRKGIQALLVR